jgi:hypothetical protein
MNAIVDARPRRAHHSKDTFFAGKAQRAVRLVARAAGAQSRCIERAAPAASPDISQFFGFRVVVPDERSLSVGGLVVWQR